MKENKVRQTVRHIRGFLSQSGLSPGERLPSVRDFADMFGVSRYTAYDAIEHLKCEGLLESHPQSGIYLSIPERAGDVNWEYLAGIGWMEENENEYYADYMNVSLSHYMMGAHFGAYEVLGETVKQSADKLKKYNNADLNPRGLSSLREQLCARMKKNKISAEPDEILLTSSVAEALMLLALAFMRTGTSYFHENIINSPINKLLKSLGVLRTPIMMDNEGMIPDKLSERIVRHRQGMVVSAMGALNPLASPSTMGLSSIARRRQLLAICESADVPLIEIDNFRDILPENAPLPLKSIDQTHRTIYIGSLTKTFLPNFKLSWIVADKRVIKKLANIRIFMSGKQDIFTQFAADEMMASGLYDEYMRKLRTMLADNKKNVAGIMDKHMKGVAEWNLNSFGFTMYIKFFDNTNVYKMYANRHKYVQFIPAFNIDMEFEKYMPVGIASLPMDKFEASIMKLAELTKKYTSV